MRTTLTIMICKLVTAICNLFKRKGTVFPGDIASKFYKDVLEKIKYPEYVIAVTGSSGKGSTVSMLDHILEGNNKKVVWNNSGSNVQTAITTLILNNSTIFTHKMKADILLLEVDERYAETIFKYVPVTHLAITNITRDQPSRNINPNIIFEKILGCIKPQMKVILNVDDPILNRIKYSHEGEVITYGIEKTTYDEKSTPNYAVDFAYCPSCNSKLKYETYHYGHLGIYACPTCSFQRGHADYEACKVDLKNANFYIGKSKLNLNKGVFFAVYYTVLAYALAREVGISEKDTLREINDDKMDSKRGKVYEFEGRKIEMLESKNENNLSYQQSLSYISLQKTPKTVIMGFENVSRRYSYNDLSWLWDIEFELLNSNNIEKIFLIGRFKYDVAVRLYYAGIDRDKIVLVDKIDNLFDLVSEKSRSDIVTMVCFDMTGIITNMLKERKQ